MRVITFSLLYFFCIGITDMYAQCDNNITSYKVYTESFSSGTTTNNVPAGLNLDVNGRLCLTHATMLDAPQSFSPSIDATGMNLSVSARRQVMVFHHLAGARNFASQNLSSGMVSSLDGNLKFTVEDIEEPLFMVDKDGDIVTIDFRKRDNQSEGGTPYNAFAEDAFAIASGYFQAAHINLLIEVNDKSEKELPSNEGVQYSISDYLAFRYMSSNGYNSGFKFYVHAALQNGFQNDDWSTLNIDYSAISYKYGTLDFDDGKSSQEQSELLSATLNHLTTILDYDISGNLTNSGNAKVDAMVINSLVNLNNSTVKNQGDAAQILYDQAVMNGLEEFDLCRILNLFTYVYGDDFFEDVTYIPSSNEGDIFIKDNAADQGVNGLDSDNNPIEESVGIVHNSPSLWNRRFLDFQSVHQSPTPVYTTNVNVTNYIHVKFNGDFCDLASISKGAALKMQIHFSINGTASWPSKWNHPSQNHPKGDLIGTLDFATGVWTDDYGLTTIINSNNLKLNPSGLLNDEPFVTIALPYRVAPFRSWSPLKFSKRATLGFHAVLLSDTFDPMSLSELGPNVETNTRNKNNAALKNTIITPRNYGGIQLPSTPKSYNPLIIPHDPDPDPITPDPYFTLGLDPSSHDPNPEVNTNPDYEVLPIAFNDYFDYGQVIFALDDTLFAAWQAGGSRGQGFIINSDNEIEVTGRNFILRGLPFPGRDLESIIGFDFISNTLPGRTGFDIVQSRNNGKEIGRFHVEIREELAGSRNEKQDDITESITIYPNPVNGDIIHLDNITTAGAYTIHALDGQIQARGKYTKDQKSLDISLIDNGVYFLRFAMNNGMTETKKLIKI